MTKISLVTPKSFTIEKTITDYVITNISITIDVSASINVSLFDANSNLLSNQCFVMSGTDYANWGSDDSIIKSFIESRIGSLTNI